MASLIATASNLIAMASNLIGASNLKAMASNLIETLIINTVLGHVMILVTLRPKPIVLPVHAIDASAD